MAEDGQYDPDAGVAPWINIVVPIMTVAIFVVVLAIVSLTSYEIDVKTLDILVSACQYYYHKSWTRFHIVCIDGWRDFTSFSTVFQSYQDDWKVTM